MRRLLGALATALLLTGCMSPLGASYSSPSSYSLFATPSLRGLGAWLEEGKTVRFDSGQSLQAALPRRIDLRAQMPPVYNQGPMRTCTGFAVSKGLAEYLLLRQNRPMELSALFGYRLATGENFKRTFIGLNIGDIPQALFEATTDLGASIASSMERLKTIGAAPESRYPYPPRELWTGYAYAELNPDFFYSPAQQRQAILGQASPQERAAGKGLDSAFDRVYTESKRQTGSDDVYRAAAVFRVREVVPVPDLDAMRRSLSAGMPVVCGVETYESFYGQAVARTGIIPTPELARERRVGGHAVLCVGYDDERQVLLMRNSWGEEWGDAGYFYLPYSFMQKGLLKDGWTAIL